MPALTRRGLTLAMSAALALPLLAACTDNAPARVAGNDATPDARSITVQASDLECGVSAATAPSGKLTFAVRNTGTQVNEFYLFAADGKRVVAEVENIGPGISRELVLNAAPGTYVTACKPGMAGDGIRAEFTVTDSGEAVGPSGAKGHLATAAVQGYQTYVRDQAEQLVAQTGAFVTAYKAGQDVQARALYPRARTHWERIEPVAESFGDLDPKMDLREADLEQGQHWTGWHRMEKDLWPARAPGYRALSKTDRGRYADDLMTNTRALFAQTRDLVVTASQIANGSRALLDEVAKAKVTGEEEHWSRTDLFDFQANVDGARVSFDHLRPLLASSDPALDRAVDQRFEELQTLLDAHRSGDGFVAYDRVSHAEVKALSDAVNALSEPLSKLAAAVA